MEYYKKKFKQNDQNFKSSEGLFFAFKIELLKKSNSEERRVTVEASELYAYRRYNMSTWLHTNFNDFFFK